MSKESIPFHVEINRIIEILAKQIYQSPLALLRENCQNAFDAILMRKSEDPSFKPCIRINIDSASRTISIEDNGIGMSREVLKNNFWRAGSSGKNNEKARKAGVVGTFGIGAMANFGVASSLTVITKSMDSNESLISKAERETLSASEDCITIEETDFRKDFGTKVISEIQPNFPINLTEAKKYITEVVKFAEVDIFFGNELLSQKKFSEAVDFPKEPAWEENTIDAIIGHTYKANVNLSQQKNGEITVKVENLFMNGRPIQGEIILKQNTHQIRTFRSKFALAPVSVSSNYGFGGIANLIILEPTAGREALTTESIQVLQTFITKLEDFISRKIVNSEFSVSNTAFLNWILKTGNFHLAHNVVINLKPEGSLRLCEIRDLSKEREFNLYSGNDKTIINQYATESNPLIVLSQSNPRRNIEHHYLTKYCKVKPVNTNPQVSNPRSSFSLNDHESSFAMRIATILTSDYFVNAKVEYGTISHNLPILVDKSVTPIKIWLDSTNSSISTFLKMYESDFMVRNGVAKDFIRDTIFPQISELVPSSTRKGAEAFLKVIRGPKDVFEYEQSDQWNLLDIWQDYVEGNITMEEATTKSTEFVRTTVQIVNNEVHAKVSDVIPDVVANQKIIDESNAENSDDTINSFSALPPITRLDIDVDWKILTIDVGKGETPLNGYTCFLALSNRVRRERGEFFSQPHRTEVIWGGQKVLFIFQHHSGEFGVYYELKSQGIISNSSGGGEIKTSTIILKNQIFIPIPESLRQSFVPFENEKRKFEVRDELLYPDL